MADAFRFAGSTFDAEVNEANELEDVQRTTFVAQPSGVAFTVSTPVGDEMVARTAQEAGEVAAIFNSAFETAGVEGLSTGQRVAPSGAISDVVYVTVSSTSGKSSTQVTVPQSQLAEGGISSEVAAARSMLDQLEGL